MDIIDVLLDEMRGHTGNISMNDTEDIPFEIFLLFL